MLCTACAHAFQHHDDANKAGNYLECSRPRQELRAPSPTPESPFYKATHHSLPRLKQSASDGCHLCILLWAAAPPKVHAFWNQVLQDDRPAHWLPSFITIDRAIFSPRQCSRRLLVEYKYQLGLTNAHDHAKPLKRHFRLLWSEEAKPLAQKARTASPTESQESWNTFKTWVWKCISEHSQCSPSSLGVRQRQLPKRLIEVSEANLVRLRTVESIGHLHAIEYIALSHCWGLIPRVILTCDSAAGLFEGVNITSLCRTFQDAIMVTKRFWDEFAVRYLWIDSLCIIQDSKEDWRQESANMGEIYQNAFCTLAATAAPDGDRGFFSDRDPRPISSLAISVGPKGGEKRSLYCVDHEDWTRNVSQGPLNGRSWVLQERLLSPRVLHFAADQLYWECSGLEASEAFPTGFPDGFGEQFKQLLPFSGLPKIEQEGPSSRGPYAIWDQVMETYSSGKLSRRTDRLVALSGIARKLQRRLIQNDTYLAGLWKQDLPFELLWDVKDPQTPDADHEYIAPTWSWASRMATVPCETETWASATTLVDITSAMVVPLDGDHMGQVCGGYIRLSGVLARGTLSRTHQPGSPTPGLALKIGDRTVSSAICRPDDGFSPAIQLPYVVYCLPILCGTRNLVPRYRGLLLVSSGHSRDFKRYGTFTADSFGDEFLVSCAPSWFDTGNLRSDKRYEVTII